MPMSNMYLDMLEHMGIEGIDQFGDSDGRRRRSECRYRAPLGSPRRTDVPTKSFDNFDTLYAVQVLRTECDLASFLHQSSSRYVDCRLVFCAPLLNVRCICHCCWSEFRLSRAQEPRIELRYPLGPDSLRHDGVPRGKVTTHVWKDSKVFPGTIRRYYVYVPAQYDAPKPAALMVFQDGHAYINEDGDFRVPDRVRQSHPQGRHAGDDRRVRRPGPQEDRSCRRSPAGSRSRRTAASSTTRSAATTPSSCSPRFCPKLHKEHPFTDDPDGHAICGISSGGICAFTVAWERPDAVPQGAQRTSAASRTSAAATATPA